MHTPNTKQRKKTRLKKQIKYILILLLSAGVLGAASLFFINLYVKDSVKDHIIAPEDIKKLPKTDCILVLGAGLKDDGTPNYMLRDRLDTAIALYKKGISNRLLMSGDHGRTNYDEVNAMKTYAINAGVPSEHIFMDHAGFSTYESACRASSVFQVKSAVVITQKYHLYRALYDMKQMGLESYGVYAKDVTYKGQQIRNAREILARAKDVFYMIAKPEPSYLGEPVPITGNGDDTND